MKRIFNPEATDPPWGDFPNDPRAFLVPKPLPYKSIIVVFLIVSILFVSVVMALAHDDYPLLCCNGTASGGDCHPVSCDSITETKDGAVWGKFKFSSGQIFSSFDLRCHICVSESGIPHCAFLQPTS